MRLQVRSGSTLYVLDTANMAMTDETGRWLTEEEIIDRIRADADEVVELP